MPDVATTQEVVVPPPPQGKLSPAKTILTAQQNVQDLTSQEMQMAQGLQKENREREAREEGDIAKLEQQREGLHPPQLTDVPKFTPPTQTDPMKQWTSAAMVFAAIGSLFTRRPLTTALNAASGVLDAYRKNDIEGANAAYKQWQDSFNNWMKVNTFELDEYKAALGDIRDEERMILDLGKEESEDRIAETRALGQAFQNTIMANVKTEQEAWQAIIQNERMQQMMEMQMPRLQILQAQAQAIAKLQQSPEFQDAMKNNPQKALDMLRGSPGWSGLTDEQGAMQVARMETQLTRVGTPGNDFMAAQRNLAAVERAAAKGAAGGVVSQAELQDAFTQIINGGRAIRSFQARMNYEHSGLYDRFMAWVNQNGFKVITAPDGTLKVEGGRGGTLSQRMIDDMKTLSEAVATDRKNVYAIDIISAQDELTGRGVSAQAASSLHPYFGDTGYLTKMRAAIKYLRDNQDKPGIVQAFDQQFGIDARFAALAGAPIDDSGATLSDPVPAQ